MKEMNFKLHFMYILHFTIIVTVNFTGKLNSFVALHTFNQINVIHRIEIQKIIYLNPSIETFSKENMLKKKNVKMPIEDLSILDDLDL